MTAALPSWAGVLQSNASAPTGVLCARNSNNSANPHDSTNPNSHDYRRPQLEITSPPHPPSPPPIVSRAITSLSPQCRLKPHYGRRAPSKTTAVPPRRRNGPVSFPSPPNHRRVLRAPQPSAVDRSTAAAGATLRAATHGVTHGAAHGAAHGANHGAASGATHHALLHESAFSSEALALSLTLRSFPSAASLPSSSPSSPGASPIQSASLLTPRAAAEVHGSHGHHHHHRDGAGERPAILPPAAATSIAVAVPADEGLDADSSGDSAFRWDGVKVLPFAASVGVGLATWALIPVPEGLTDQAWQLLAVFLTTITGLILGPLPVGAWAFVCLSFAILTGTLPFSDAISAMTNEVIWLIVISFFFARGFVTTGLGDRIATLFVQWFGSSTLGLSYGLAASEAILAPAMPSTTARAGGVFLPIIDSLSKRFDSRPNDPSSSKLGAYLIMTQLQCTAHSSAMFLTGAGQNLLCLKLAQEMGVAIPNAFGTWMQMAVAPGVVGLMVTPLVMFRLFPPEVKETPEAPALAAKRLKEMGGVSGKEMIMIGTMGLAITMWIMGESLGIPSVVTAMSALSLLLLSGVVSWSDCLSERTAWDTLMWFAALIAMSNQLTHMGVVGWMADGVAGGLGMVPGGILAGDMATGGMLGEEMGGVVGLLGGDVGEMVGATAAAAAGTVAAVGGAAGAVLEPVTSAVTIPVEAATAAAGELTWVSSFFQLQVLYFLSHYLFASQTAHVGALYAAFLAMQLAAGVPGEVGAFALAINTNLFGAITHYSSGQAALYYGAGYVKLPDLFKVGGISAIINLVLWTTVCSILWKFQGVF
ncbi:hypothetical protein CLOM_g12904 [Closterium sp. NIES-68]|nr:hypothetical protein CLOM_g12904 [Closterium sp. NIES-68]GJP83159.1 hypothetical protein CLOP_g13353 [Closterium sp. NIES-67]